MTRRPLAFRAVTDGLDFPEGPIAMADGSVLVVEIRGGRLVRVLPDGAKQVVAELGGGPNGAAIGPDGAVYVCNNGGFSWGEDEAGRPRPTGRAADYVTGSIQRVDLATGAVATLYDRCGDVALAGPNDIVFDRDGGFWFTDHGKSYGRLMDRGAVYYAAADGSHIREAAFPVITPNGIGLSPDERTLYVSETETGRLWAFAVAAPGVLAREPFPSPAGGRFVGGSSGYQRFDSFALQQDGAVCLATLVDGGISVFSPGGDLLAFHETPDRFTTNICFGGQDLRTAYVTLSASGRLVAADWPAPGLPLLHQRG